MEGKYDGETNTYNSKGPTYIKDCGPLLCKYKTSQIFQPPLNRISCGGIIITNYAHQGSLNLFFSSVRGGSGFCMLTFSGHSLIILWILTDILSILSMKPH